ncbi:nonclathrin coat protein zeta2-cop-related protein, putative [Babesia bigemina]|uniref:Coatomer subunit zeta n=1 Tax=Babesia bigemina TaxID=5866 RepID=A0A061D6Z9_BABBI|nr:nonclathrin coat protein zeta2-cop-related protein, putative [Babesia bigemina]CDR96288.1 nonclathrin coat protein zeta2-cop-related protein, putative [Babesia bigemina]|eukprot:XP_012768474.1 nonclathrin coat protein zeta2-cop-related protein, putative [Babesia bigemina]
MAYIPITQVDAILLLDQHGERIAVNYYPQHCAATTSADGVKNLWEDVARQKVIEKSLTKELELAKARGTEITLVSHGVTEGAYGIRMIEGHLVSYYIAADFAIIVVGPSKENEVLLTDLCTTVKKCLLSVTDEQLKKEVVCNKLDSVFLILDDVVDGGFATYKCHSYVSRIIMESDHNVIIRRLKGKSGDSSDHLPLNQAIYNIRNNVIRSLLNS